MLLRLFVLMVLCISKVSFADDWNDFATESNSPTDYKELATHYQQQADFYNALADSIESTESVVKPYNPFVGSQIGIGGGNATGAGENTNFSSSLIFNYDPTESKTGWNFNTIGQYDYLYTPNEGNKKNRLYLQQNTAYGLDDYNGIFTQVSYLNDKNDGYFFVFNENIGYQLQLFKNSTNSLLINLGPGLQQRHIIIENYVETQPQFLSQLTYNLKLNNILTLYEQVQYNYTSVNKMTYSLTQLNFLIIQGVSLGINYQLTYNSNPVGNINPLTTISSFQINYSIN